MRRTGWCLLFLFGCPASEGERKPVEPGRLKARYLDAGEGARYFLGWYDSELEAPCTFEAWSDGVYRCTPGYSRGGLAGLGGGVAQSHGEFIDDECSEPIVIASLCGVEQQRFVREYPLSAGDAVSSCSRQKGPDPIVRGITGRERPLGDFFVSTNGVCTRVESRPTSATYFELSAPIPERVFVRAERVFEVKSDRFGVWTLASEDGGREELGIFDQVRQVECDPDRSLGVCLPAEGRTIAAGSSTTTFDASCVEPITVAFRSLCTAPEILVTRIPTSSCSLVSRVAKIAQEIPGDALRTRDAAGQCGPHVGGGSGFVVDDEAPDLGPIQIVTMGDGPIVLAGYGAENGAPFRSRAIELREVATGRPCTLISSDEPDVDLCIPDRVINGGFDTYADSACTRPAISLTARAFQCTGFPELVAAQTYDPDARCGDRGHVVVRPVLGPIEGSEFVLIPGSQTCAPSPSSPRTMYELGAPIDLSTFHKVRRFTE